MKKTSAALLALCLSLLALCACTSGGEQADFSLEDCSRELLGSDAFTELL